MKLYLTLGNRPENLPDTHTDSAPISYVVDVPEGNIVTYMGLEIEANELDPDEPGFSKTGRLTIVRIPFHQHAGATMHTICSLNGGVESIGM